MNGRKDDFRAGGIIGKTYDNYNNHIKNCCNKGEILSSAYRNIIGGIVANSGKATIEQCYNSGNIECNNTDSDNDIGGIAGNSSKYISISNSYNKGKIYFGDNKGDYSRIGGIIGYYMDSGIIKNCYNVGAIEGSLLEINNTYSGLGRNIRKE